jgi:hypothetical protein
MCPDRPGRCCQTRSARARRRAPGSSIRLRAAPGERERPAEREANGAVPAPALGHAQGVGVRRVDDPGAEFCVELLHHGVGVAEA